MKYGTKHKGCTIIKVLWSRKEKTGSSKKIHETVCKQEYVENRTSIVKYRKGKYHENLEAKINYHKGRCHELYYKKRRYQENPEIHRKYQKKEVLEISRKENVTRMSIFFNK